MDDDVRAPTPLDRLVAWLGPPRSYLMVRNAIVRLLGVIYVFAFLGILFQGLPLLGHHGLTPIDTYVDQLRAAGATVWDVPSLFMFDASDPAILAWAGVGLAIAVPVALGYANVPRVRAVRLDGCGHFVMLDRPADLARVIAAFAAKPLADELRASR